MDAKNLTSKQIVCYLPKNIAYEYKQRKMIGELDRNFLAEVEYYLKPKGIPYSKLIQLDESYFKPEDEDKEYISEDTAAHRLATWIYDNEGNETVLREKAKRIVSSYVYVKMLECLVDGNHDT